MLIVVNWHISLDFNNFFLRHLWQMCTVFEAAAQRLNVISLCRNNQNVSFVSIFQFAQCTPSSNNTMPASFDQLHCYLLESVSVRSLVECKEIYDHVCVCVSFSVPLKINFHCERDKYFALWCILSIWTFLICAMMHGNGRKCVQKSRGPLTITHGLNWF